LQWCVAAAEADKEEIKIARMQQYSTHTTQKKENNCRKKILQEYACVETQGEKNGKTAILFCPHQ